MTSKPVPLGQWLSCGRPARHLVAFHEGRRWYQSELLADVKRLYAVLDKQPGQRWALCCDSSYAFLVALLAALHCGKTPVIPGHDRLALLREQAAGFDGMLSDKPLALACPIIDPLSLADAGDVNLAPLDEKAGVVLFTSGSTGKPQAVFKPVALLDKEIIWLAKLWGTRLAGCRVIASVSHQHLYGLTFRIMLPMALGLASDAYPIRWPEQLSACRDADYLFISSPAFLKRLDEGLMPPLCRMAISAAGILEEQTARLVRAWLGVAVAEIYGSTETGVLAWREHQESLPPWRPFPPVRFGRHRVVSPLIVGGSAPLADRLEFDSSGGFLIRGRRDRIVKIEEKRISLDEIEQRLCALTDIKEAAVLPLKRDGRLVIGAAIVLRTNAEDGAVARGRWRKELGRWLDPLAVPRLWRIVENIPLNSQSKRAWTVLQELFDDTH